MTTSPPRSSSTRPARSTTWSENGSPRYAMSSSTRPPTRRTTLLMRRDGGVGFLSAGGEELRAPRSRAASVVVPSTARSFALDLACAAKVHDRRGDQDDPDQHQEE